MTALSQMLGVNPVGSIVQAPYNLTDPRYLPCDGRKVDRSQYPLLAACAPSVGTFTFTQRTGRQATAPAGWGGNIINDGTNWFAASGNFVNVGQYSADGITWTPVGIGVGDAHSIISDGVNMVLVGAANAYYSTTHGASWTSVTGAPSSGGGASQIALAPTIGATGRMLINSYGANAIWTSDDRGVNWTSRGAVMPSNGYGVCWTGSNFLVGGNIGKVYASPTGLSGTWSTILPFGGRGNFVKLVSDGSNRVACWDPTLGLLFYSIDGGSTWASRSFGSMYPDVNAGQIGRWNGPAALSYTNGRFFLAFGAGTNASQQEQQFFCSADLLSWVALSDLVNQYSSGVVTNTTQFSYKSGVYFGFDAYTAASGFSLVEDTTKMYLPNGFQGASGGALPSSYNNFQPFIRVK